MVEQGQTFYVVAWQPTIATTRWLLLPDEPNRVWAQAFRTKEARSLHTELRNNLNYEWRS
jgi:hypothetical protein